MHSTVSPGEKFKKSLRENFLKGFSQEFKGDSNEI
jgi:hypothetical protein